jgi:nicotinate-nucleotide adenylyltransferase
MQKILLFGGTFNPIHNGHLIISRSIAESLDIKKILLIPSGNPPYKKNVLNPQIRLEMVKEAVGDDPFYEICDCEFNRKGPSYSIDTIKWIKERYGKRMEQVYWMIGEDNLEELPKWYGIDKLVSECRFVVACRMSSEKEIEKTWKKSVKRNPNLEEMHVIFLQSPIINISSTMIRSRVQEGKTIKYIVPESVENYIIKNNLYQKK